MPEEFEKNIQKKLQDFNLEPSHQVWSEIDAALSEKKRRRFVFWWWLLPVMLAAGAGVWVYKTNSSKEETENRKAGGQSEKRNTNEEKSIQPQEKDTDESLADNKQESSRQLSEDSINQLKNNALTNNAQKQHISSHKLKENAEDIRSRPETTLMNSNKETRKKEETSVIEDDRKTTDTVSAGIPQIKEGNTLPVQPVKETNANITGDKKIRPVDTATQILATTPGKSQENIFISGEKKDSKTTGPLTDSSTTQPTSTTVNIVPQRLTVTKDSAVINSVNKKIKVTTANKTHWHIIVGGGITSTNAKGTSKLANSASYSDVTSPSTPGSGSNNGSSARADSTSLIVKPQTGYHLLAGISYEHTLSKRWKISAGLQYRFLSNTQKTGRSIDSTLKVLAQSNYTSSLSNLASIDNFNYAGYSSTATNTAHWLEVPLTIEYTLNPSNKTKYYIDAGVSYAWMFASKWLIPDSRYSKLYYNNDFLNHHILNWQLGFGINTINGWKFGLKYQQSSTTVAEKFIEPHLRWQNISFYTGIPLNIKRHSTK